MHPRLPAGGIGPRVLLLCSLPLVAALGCDDTLRTGLTADASGPDADASPRDAQPTGLDQGRPDAAAAPADARPPTPDAPAPGPDLARADLPLDAALTLEDGARPPVDAAAPPPADGALIDARAPAPDFAQVPDLALVPDFARVPDFALVPDLALPADALGPSPDLGVRPDAVAPPTPDAAVLPGLDAAAPPVPDAATPDAGDATPDAGPPCGGEPVNACGGCGPLPLENCNRLDDDCDGETDEGDADADGMNDCGELVSGLNPADPTDNVGDPDHDGVDNPAEVLAGTWAVPVVFLTAEATDDPARFDVVVNLAQPDADLQPILAEVFIHSIGRVEYEETLIGPSAVAADKQLFAAPIDANLTRFTLTAPNIERLPPGELARLRFRRAGAGEARFFFDVDADQFAPIETQTAATYGVGHPAEPLVLAGVPLVIDEIDYDQIGTDRHEFVEIRNPNPMPVSLAGLALEVRNGANGVLLGTTDLSGAGAELGPGQRLVCGMRNVLTTLPPGVLGVAQGPNLPNLDGAVRIVDIHTDPPTVIDALCWEGARVRLGLCETAPAPEDPNDVADGSLGRCPGAADTNDNSVDFVLQVSTPGVENVCR